MTAAGLRPPSGSLPADLTSFVGRRQQLERGRQLLGAGRLVTLVGTGGVGKSRLGMRLASGSARTFAGGTWCADLAAVSDPALVPQAVCDVFRVADRGSAAAIELLVDRLGSSRALLVLDGCDHVLDACAALVERLLEEAPGLHVLATSRQPLGVAGEALLRVEPLSEADARRLFLERAAAAGYVPEAGEEAAIDLLCTRLDRLPLAIELVAGRAGAIAVAEMLERLDSSFDVLHVSRRRGPTRQQTLRATLDWSHRPLEPPLRAAWRRLSLFDAAFRLPAAEALLGSEAVELVSALVDRSILAASRAGRHTWYRMLETVRQYGRERLDEASEREDAERSFVAWYVRVAEEAERRQSGPADDPVWPDELDREQGNLRLALALAGRLDAGAQLRIAAALVPYWDLRGHLAEGRQWLDRALAAAPAEASARALDGAGWLAMRQDDRASAKALFERAGAVAEAVGDLGTQARALSNLGLVALLSGRAEDAERLLDRSIETARAAGLRAVELGPLLMRAMLRYASGHLSTALAGAGECLVLARELGNLKTLAAVVATRAVIELDLGDAISARQDLEEALSIVTQTGDQVTAAEVLDVGARLWGRQGDHQRCLELAAAADSLRQATGAAPLGLLQVLVADAVGRAREVLGARRADAAWRRGAGMGMQAALVTARSQPAPPASRPSDAVAATGADAGPLTKRESEIAGLVAEGLSNRGIAERLMIGRRTVETHVEHILNKLGVSSRAEVAAWVSQRGS